MDKVRFHGNFVWIFHQLNKTTHSLALSWNKINTFENFDCHLRYALMSCDVYCFSFVNISKVSFTQLVENVQVVSWILKIE